MASQGKSTKVQANPNSERTILRNLVNGTINRLNNVLIVNEQKHRYGVSWEKGTGYIENAIERTNHYYKLECFIDDGEGGIIHVYGGNYPIGKGTSMLNIYEAEIKAYKDFLLHSIGALISVQHGTFLQLEAAEKNNELQNQQKSNLIL